MAGAWCAWRRFGLFAAPSVRTLKPLQSLPNVAAATEAAAVIEVSGESNGWFRYCKSSGGSPPQFDTNQATCHFGVVHGLGAWSTRVQSFEIRSQRLVDELWRTGSDNMHLAAGSYELGKWKLSVGADGGVTVEHDQRQAGTAASAQQRCRGILDEWSPG